MKSIPGWTLNIDKISNGVFKVTLTDGYGRKAEVIDDASDETINKAIGDAFNIERQISKNWNKFLYEFFLQRIDKKVIINKDYNDNEFGSWFIELLGDRIVYDGKDSWLILQKKNKSGWTDKKIIQRNEQTYSRIIELISE